MALPTDMNMLQTSSDDYIENMVNIYNMQPILYGVTGGPITCETHRDSDQDRQIMWTSTQPQEQSPHMSGWCDNLYHSNQEQYVKDLYEIAKNHPPALSQINACGEIYLGVDEEGYRMLGKDDEVYYEDSLPALGEIDDFAYLDDAFPALRLVGKPLPKGASITVTYTREEETQMYYDCYGGYGQALEFDPLRLRSLSVNYIVFDEYEWVGESLSFREWQALWGEEDLCKDVVLGLEGVVKNTFKTPSLNSLTTMGYHGQHS